MARTHPFLPSARAGDVLPAIFAAMPMPPVVVMATSVAPRLPPPPELSAGFSETSADVAMADGAKVDLERVREAVRRRATYFLEHATYVATAHEREVGERSGADATEVDLRARGCRWNANRNVTLKKCRRILERDLGLEEKKLDQVKKDVHEIIDRALMGGTQTDLPPPRPVETEIKRGEKKETKTKHAHVKSNSSMPAHNQRHKSAKTERSNAEEKNSGTRSARVEKLKRILKTATITISPNIYVKHKREDELYEALCGLLKKEGLSPNPSDREIAAVRKRKQIERDLDGIDTSNIISTGRRRRTSADAQYTYKEEDESDEDADESTPQPSSQLEGNDPDSSDLEEASPRRAPSHKRPHAQDQADDTSMDKENCGNLPKRRTMVISDEED